MKAERIWRNARFMPDGRVQAQLNGCAIHRNVCDIIKWPDGSEECMLCARDRQAAAMTANPAFNMPPYWDWAQ